MGCFYIGYGFNAYSLNDSTLVEFVKKSSFADDFEKYIKEESADAEEVVIDFMEEVDGDVANFVASEINAAECERAKKIGYDLGHETMVVAYGPFVVFDCIRFAEEDKRSRIIRTEGDFLQMMARNFPKGHTLPKSGNVWVGNEWLDLDFWME